MYLRSIKKLGAEVFLEEPIGKDKDDNTKLFNYHYKVKNTIDLRC